MAYPDFPDYGKERSLLPAFETLLSRLSPTPEALAARPDQLSKLYSEQIDIDGIRTSLREARHRLEISREEISILKEPQFRNLNQGRGSAVRAILGSFRAQELMSFISGITYGIQGRIVSGKTGTPIEGSQGRGLRHFVADTLLLVAQPTYLDAFCQKLNQRALKGLLTAYEYRTSPDFQKIIRDAFPDVEDKVDNPRFIGIPPGTLVPTWQYLVAKRDRF